MLIDIFIIAYLAFAATWPILKDFLPDTALRLATQCGINHMWDMMLRPSRKAHLADAYWKLTDNGGRSRVQHIDVTATVKHNVLVRLFSDNQYAETLLLAHYNHLPTSLANQVTTMALMVRLRQPAPDGYEEREMTWIEAEFRHLQAL